MNNYVNRKPEKLIHMGPLMFPLSFQQNNGATVGDSENMFTSDGKMIWSPSIGVDI